MDSIDFTTLLDRIDNLHREVLSLGLDLAKARGHMDASDIRRDIQYDIILRSMHGEFSHGEVPR